MARKCKIASFFSGSRGIDQIKEIGNNMVKCSSAQEGGPCARIVTCQNNLNDAEIIPPRCLYLDEFRANEEIGTELIYRIKKKNRKYFIQCGDLDLELIKQNISFELVNKRSIISKDHSECDKKIDCPALGIIVIGKNPGKISETEVKTFTDPYKQDLSLLYEGISTYWRNNWFHGAHEIPFYNNINWLLNYLNKGMPSLDLKQVLWTEIIKCQFALEMKTKFKFKISYFIHWLNEDIDESFKIINNYSYKGDGILTINSLNEEGKLKINGVLEEWKLLMATDDDIESNLIEQLFEKPDEEKLDIKINFKKYFEAVLEKELAVLENKHLKKHIKEASFDWDKCTFNLTRNLDKDLIKEIGAISDGKNITELKNNLNKIYLAKLEKYFLQLTLFRNKNDLNQSYKDTSEYFESANECHRKYLKEELAISAVKDWPIICIGKDEFKFISFAYPDRIVIGLPHVTGAHGDAPKIYDYTKKDDQFENVRKSIVQWLDWRLSRRNTVDLEKGNYTVPNARYFDLSSKVL